MWLFELVVVLLLAGTVLAVWSDRLGLPYPALLALVGTVVALLPGVPELTLDPELALTLFVAPTLVEAGYYASARDLRHNLGRVSSLAVGLVLITVAAVAGAVRVVVPGMGWPAAFALGAIVAPPDASAAVAILRKLRPPHQLMVILEGESLFNDATALLVYRVAVATALTGAFTGWSVLPIVLVTCGGGIVLGWILARLLVWVTNQVEDITASVMLQFTVTFAVWILAEQLRVSAIITMVTYAMTIARDVGGRMDARRRIASVVVWDLGVRVLNVLAFALIGLQLRGILARIHGRELRTYAFCAAVACATVIVVRVCWVMVHVAAMSWNQRRRRVEHRKRLPAFRAGLLASWAGMRGIVTLAAALALPEHTPALPHRDLMVFSAFCVVLATLVVQGLTLGPMMRLLGLRDEGMVDQEVVLARERTARTALRELEGAGPVGEILRREYEARLRAARAPEGSSHADTRTGSVASLQRKMVEAQRRSLRELRSRDVIGDHAFHVMEEELDLLELTADERVRPTNAQRPSERRGRNFPPS